MDSLWTTLLMEKGTIQQKAPAPIVIKRGFVQLKIYQGITTARGRSYSQFSLVYHDGTRRVRLRYSDLAEAKRKADEIATQLVRGDHLALQLTGVDRTTYLASRSLADELGKPLQLIVEEYSQAAKLLPTDIPLLQAVQGFLTRQNQIKAHMTVQQVVEEMLEAKSNARRSDVHLKDLRSRLSAFAKDFKMRISDLQVSAVQKWIDALPLGSRTKLNYCRHISSLVRFAVRRRYASSELVSDMEAIELPEITPTETEVFTPDELREMLMAARGELIPWLAIAAFCGLRTAEILRLEWKDVHLEEGFVEVRALNAKTGARRSVPLCDAALSWLQPHAGSDSRVAHYSNENKFCPGVVSAVRAARRLAGNAKEFTWKRNGMRHSFCSYRLAILKDAPRVALEAGNSPTMIFRHYHRLSTDSQASKWFGVMRPAEQTNGSS